jgi:hypothetical protein
MPDEHICAAVRRVLNPRDESCAGAARDERRFGRVRAFGRDANNLRRCAGGRPRACIRRRLLRALLCLPRAAGQGEQREAEDDRLCSHDCFCPLEVEAQTEL